MSIRPATKVVTASCVGICITAYFAAVEVNVQVNSVDNWWPYPWLWILAAVALAASATWVFLMLVPGKVEPDPLPSVTSTSHMFELAEDKNLALPQPPDKQPPVLSSSSTPGHVVFGGMEANIRASDMRLVVSFTESGQRVGVISPERGGYSAHHFYGGDAGWYQTVEDAMRAIWQLD